MNKIRFLILLCLLCQTSLLSAQITLQSCFDLAEKNSPQTQLLPLAKESETLQIGALTKNNLPQASLSGQATWQSQVTGLNLDIPNVKIPTVSKDQYKATLDISQNLWDGGAIKSQKLLATATYNTDVKSIENNIYQIKEQISNLYFGVLLADKQLANTEITKNDLESQLKKQEANVQNGTAIKSNVMTLNARLIELKQQNREILSRRLYALKGLSILTGKDFPENTVLEEPSKEIENVVLSTESIDRPELKLYDAQKDLAEANKSLIRAKNLPKVNLFATGGYGRPALNFLSSEFSTYFIGGLSFKIPLSHLYTKSQDSDFQQININKAKIDKQKDGFLQNIQLKLASQKEDIAKLQDQIQEDLKLIEIRTYMKKTAEKRLENGVITLSDYISEVDNETLAKQNLSLHEVQLLQGFNNIKITIGKL
jgi:outer membrane protein TolC